MTLPVLDKTWQFNVNNFVAADATESGTQARADARGVLLGIKNALTGFGTLPWTVVSSSNSSTSGASDNWSTIADIVWATSDSSAHSWMVLQQTGIASTFQILLNCVHGATSNRGDNIEIYVSRTGFTGGTTTQRPTGTEEINLRLNQQWGTGSVNGGARNYRYHVMQSTDGQETIVVTHFSGSPVGFWVLGRPKSPIAAWTNDYIATVLGVDNGGDAPDVDDYYDTDFNLRTYTSQRAAVTTEAPGTTRLFMTGRSFNNNHAAQAHTVPNDITGEYPIYPIGLMSNDSAFKGYMGRVFDIYWGLQALAEGDTYPSGGSKIWVQFGDILFPWNGSVPQTS